MHLKKSYYGHVGWITWWLFNIESGKIFVYEMSKVRDDEIRDIMKLCDALLLQIASTLP